MASRRIASEEYEECFNALNEASGFNMQYTEIIKEILSFMIPTKYFAVDFGGGGMRELPRLIICDFMGNVLQTLEFDPENARSMRNASITIDGLIFVCVCVCACVCVENAPWVLVFF